MHSRLAHAARTLLVFLAWASSSAPVSAQEARLRHALAPRIVLGEVTHAWPRQPLLSEARAQIGVPWVWSERGALGEGATVCVIDTGIDLNHRDFLDARGATRVRYLLDLDAMPRGVHPELEREGGAVWTAEEIDAARAMREPLPIDWHGHGTIIASAAAGDDSESEALGPEAGVAPRASLVVVRALRRDTLGISDDDIARGASFCAAVSEPSRTSMVIALGGHDGPHDGTSPIERMLTGIAHQGFAVVVAAGNDAQQPIHASTRLVGNEIARFTLRVPAPEIDEALVAVVVHGARSVRLRSSRGTSPWVGRGETFDDGVLRITRSDDEDDASSTLVLRGDLPFGALTIEVRGAEVTMRGPAPMAHAWLAQADLGSLFAARFEGETARVGEEVRVPATADGVIAVGASVSRGFVPGLDGPGLTADEDEDGRALYSARGPRVDGAPLPHLLAPGGWVSAALSEDLEAENPAALFGGSTARLASQRRGTNRVMALGTSISAAVVGGAIALARGLAPGSEDDVRMLLGTARAEDAWRATSGMGLVDLEAWIRMREGTDGDALRVGCTRDWALPSANDVQIVARSNSHAPQAFSLFALHASQTQALGSLDLREGLGVARLDLPSWATSEVRVEARAGDVVRGECVLRVTLDGAPNPPRAFGGCTATSRVSTTWWTSTWWVLLALLGWLRRGRDRRSA